MKQTTEELKAIIASAPEGANYISMMGYVLNELDDWYFWSPVKQEYVYLVLYDYEDSWEFQSLDDIREIVGLRERVAELEANQAKRDLEVTRKGFWLGFESARCYPSENNILMKWEETLYFKQAQELGK